MTQDCAVVNEKGKTIQITDDGGLSKKIVKLGTGPTPKKGDQVQRVVSVNTAMTYSVPFTVAAHGALHRDVERWGQKGSVLLQSLGKSLLSSCLQGSFCWHESTISFAAVVVCWFRCCAVRFISRS